MSSKAGRRNRARHRWRASFVGRPRKWQRAGIGSKTPQRRLGYTSVKATWEIRCDRIGKHEGRGIGLEIHPVDQVGGTLHDIAVVGGSTNFKSQLVIAVNGIRQNRRRDAYADESLCPGATALSVPNQQ